MTKNQRVLNSMTHSCFEKRSMGKRSSMGHFKDCGYSQSTCVDCKIGQESSKQEKLHCFRRKLPQWSWAKGSRSLKLKIILKKEDQSVFKQHQTIERKYEGNPHEPQLHQSVCQSTYSWKTQCHQFQHQITWFDLRHRWTVPSQKKIPLSKAMKQTWLCT